MITNDQWIYLIDNRGDQRIVKVQKNKKLKWRKQTINLEQLAAHPFNTIFKVDQQGQISKEDNVDLFYFPHDKDKEKDADSDSDQSKDNRNLNDKNISQKLTQNEINELKQTDEGEEIVKKIVANSETFNQKTQYSQAKYLQKKMSKYVFYFCVEQVTLNKLQRCWYSETPAKINFIRIDVLAHYLQLCGIIPNSNILVFENTFVIYIINIMSKKGLCLAGILQRLGNQGQIQVIFTQFNQHLKDMLPFAQMNFPSDSVKQLKEMTTDQIQETDKFTHLLIAGEYKFRDIIENCEQNLSPGGNIVIYSSFLEALIEVAEYMVSKQQYSQPWIFDSFMREYQILPNRTHPKVEMNAFGGYLLQAYKFE